LLGRVVFELELLVISQLTVRPKPSKPSCGFKWIAYGVGEIDNLPCFMERLSMSRLLVEAQYIVTIGYGESYSMGMPSWRNNVPMKAMLSSK
jgi:hypothetical protein